MDSTSGCTMTSLQTQRLPERLAALLLASSTLLFAACTGSEGGSGSSSNSQLTLDSISVMEGQTWQINRPIQFLFSEAIDFDTVNPNTIQVSQTSGEGTVGEFYLDESDPRRLYWQPVCPTEADYSDAGLLPDTEYRIFARGADTSPVTVTSASGRPLSIGQTVNFQTSIAGDLSELFFDPTEGPPIPLVRAAGGTGVGTYVEFGGDPTARTYFEYNEDGEGVLVGGDLVPLNLYSDSNSQVVMVIEFNQPVNPAESNIHQNRVRLEFDADLDPISADWRAVTSEVELYANCTDSGSTVRITPIGIIPQDRDLRLFISAEFEDLRGQRNPLPLTTFALSASETAAGDITDHFSEEFDAAPGDDGSLADISAVAAEPRAEWGDGGLEAGLGFGGTGGPNAEFDWHIAENTDFRVDTNSTQIFGGPGGIPIYQQFVLNGRVDVRDLYIPASSILRIQGEDPVTIFATGTVTIDGQLLANGGNARSVFTLNTPFQPEHGAAGVAGGGGGGTGSYLTNQSTPRGGRGYGAFQTPNGGGEGGETGYSPINTNYGTARRAAGGGGARLGHDVLLNGGCPQQLIIGLDAEDGFPGAIAGAGAEGNPRAYGGHMGPQPFYNPDGDAQDFEDDFYGVMLRNYDGDLSDPDPEARPRLVVGELPSVWAGAGGGAGGDASRTESYPPLAFVYSNEDKGCGGGGGGGSLTILALGDVTFGPNAKLNVSGGFGSGGENTAGTNRIGGGSGGGSGGHLIIQTSGKIDLRNLPTNWNALNDTPPIVVKGGQGGAGAGDVGGANNGETQPTKDAVHDGNTNPFSFDACGGAQNVPKDCAGGDGGPGIIQFHVSNLDTDIIPPGGTIEQNLGLAVMPPPLGYEPVSGRWEHQLLPAFGRISSSQSTWVPLGGVAIESGTTVMDDFSFAFAGTDTTTGEILRTDETVNSLGAILTTAASLETPDGTTGLPAIDSSNSTMVIVDAADFGAGNEVYLSNPSLLTRYRVVVGADARTIVAVEYTETDASHGGAATLRIYASNEGGTFPLAGTVSIIPRYFALTTTGVEDSLPDSASVTIEFQATSLSTLGSPDEGNIKPAPGAWAADISTLNYAGNSELQFVRFRVRFDIGVGTELSATTPRPRLEFLTIPFTF
jgi:hypothetical protein